MSDVCCGLLWCLVFGQWSVMGYGSQRLAEVISTIVSGLSGQAGSGPFGNLILLSGFLLLKT